MKIKIGLGIWIAIAIILGAVFLSDYDNQAAEASSASEKIKTDTLTLAKISQSSKAVNNDILTLNANIVKTQAEIQATGNTLPEKVNSNEVIKAIFGQSVSNQVTLVPLSTQPWSTLNINKSEIRIFKMAFSANGTEANVASFIQWIQNSPYPTLVVENFTISKPNDSDNSGNVESKINLAVYSK